MLIPVVREALLSGSSSSAGTAKTRVGKVQSSIEKTTSSGNAEFFYIICAFSIAGNTGGEKRYLLL